MNSLESYPDPRSLRLGNLQRLVLGLCTVHENMTIAKLAKELERSPSEIARVVAGLEDRNILRAMSPAWRGKNMT